jgi:hypothetical protein
VPAALREALGAHVVSPADPYPDLPTIPESELRDGDVLLMLGEGWPKIHGIPLPVSWLIRLLDGGAYSHAAVVSWEGAPRAPRVWDHSAAWRLGPVPVARAIAEHAYCHVYRFEKGGEPLDGPDYPSRALVAALRGHANDPYDMALLLMAGVVALISRTPESETERRLLRLALTALVEVLEWVIGHADIRGRALVCTAVAGVSFWEARPVDPSKRFALEADLDRRRDTAPAVVDPDWDAVIARIRRALAQLWPSFEAELAARQAALDANARWVEIGSVDLPVNLVAPSDLELSRTLRRVAKLAVPKPQAGGSA